MTPQTLRTDSNPVLQRLPTIPISPSSTSQHLFQSAFNSSGRIFTDLFSGYDSPLSSAILDKGGQIFRMDILLDPMMDILSDDFAEQLLRFCASGKSAYIACSPCCSEYSRLKLIPGSGPKPLRTPVNLGGVPGLKSAKTARLQTSFLQLSRGVQCLQVGFCAGSHGHLEQPPNAMSWEEEVVQGWLREAGCSCVHLPACKFGLDFPKSWLFASSLEGTPICPLQAPKTRLVRI